MNPLGQAFDQYLATRQDVMSGEVYDEATGATYQFQPGLEFDSASIIKATIMATLLWQSQRSGRSLPTAQQQLMTTMIEDSSNSAATTLWYDAGGSGGIQRFLDAAGMDHTVPGQGGYWGRTQVNVVDETTLLKLLTSPNPVLSPASRSYELHLMANVILSEASGVSSGVAPGSTVALKNGWLPWGNQGWFINSIGVVASDKATYCVTLLSRGAPSESYGIQTLDTISTMIANKLEG